jgi:hypothetical protein
MAAEHTESSQHTIVIDASLQPIWTGTEPGEAAVSGRRIPERAKYAFRSMKATNGINGLVHAVHTAFAQHFTLELRPDVLWYTILSQIAIHVRKNPEAHRATLVKHAEGKETITVQNDAVLDTPDAWATVFPEFKKQLIEKCAENNTTHAIFGATFETKDPIAEIASNVVIMDVMESYFSYVIMSYCGIPHVILKESKASWIKLLAHVTALDLHKTVGMDKQWYDTLLSTLNKIVNEHGAAMPDVGFWKNIYKYGERSGGTYVDGWIRDFFCYTSKGERRTLHSVSDFPSSVSAVPFLWKISGYQDRPMTFYAGIDDAHVANGVVSCAFGWAVAHR